MLHCKKITTNRSNAILNSFVSLNGYNGSEKIK